MRSAPVVSSYLAKPSLSKGKFGLFSISRELAGIRRHQPHFISRIWTILLVWCLSIGAIQLLLTPHNLPDQSFASTASADTMLPVTGANAPAVKYVPTTARTSILNDDATGQMLPPIPMSPPRSFGNSYAAGECTWYVASRRQVPRNWGNANTWYARAAADGWGVGTTPTIGAIAQTTAGSLGHVALVEDISPDYQTVQISEMNYKGRYVTDKRWVPAKSFHYIYSH